MRGLGGLAAGQNFLSHKKGSARVTSSLAGWRPSPSGLVRLFGVGMGGAHGEIWGDTGGADTAGRTTRAQVISAQRRCLGGETGDCRKRGLLSRSAAGPSRVRRVRRVLRPVGEPGAGALGQRRGCRQDGSRVRVCWRSLVGRG